MENQQITRDLISLKQGISSLYNWAAAMFHNEEQVIQHHYKQYYIYSNMSIK